MAKPAGQGAGLMVTNSELVVGRNRLALVVLEDGKPLPGTGLKVDVFQIEGQSGTKRAEVDAVYRSIEGTGRGVYTASVSFDQPGPWGFQATATRPDRPPLAVRTSFEVKPTSTAPRPGDRAIASRNPIAGEVTSLTEICSAQPPCPLHDVSLASALARARPVVAAFATPGYCTSQACAPVLNEVVKVWNRRSEAATFVHVEIYKDSRNLVVADAVTEWGLASEPWIYLIDRGGVVSERIESITTADEIDAALAPLI